MGASSALSAQATSRQACAAIWSLWPILQWIDTSEPSEAVCVEVAHPDQPLLVYGSIIAYAG
jgi:hypothetical protein